MPLVSSECIILRNQDYLERDRLVTFLTRDAGRVRGIVKGSRKLTSRGVGSFEVFSRGVMHWVDKGREGLVTIRKCDPLPPYLYLHGGYHAFLYAGYFAELADLCPIDPADSEPFFTLLADSIAALCEPGPARRLALLRLRFDLHFLQLLGYQPDWRRCCACGRGLLRAGDGPAEPDAPEHHQFDVAQGGVRCPQCVESAHRSRPVLPAQALAVLENWRQGRAGPAARPTRAALEALQSAVTLHLTHRLEREPRTLALLPGLDVLEREPGEAPQPPAPPTGTPA